jgi:hypothetical protein
MSMPHVCVYESNNWDSLKVLDEWVHS